MTTLTEEYIESIITKVAANLKLTKWRYDVLDFENIGQNYFGIIMPVVITESNEKGCFNSHHIMIVLKLAPTDERYRVSGAVTSMFRREIFVYSKLFKKYQEFEISPWPSFVIPSSYFVRDTYCREVIAMEDMRSSGYKPYTHKSFLDIDHVTIALGSLARLHALSFVLKERDSELYDEVTKECVPLTENSNKRYMDVMEDRLNKALKKFESTQYVPLLENLKLNCGRLFDKAIELAMGTCIGHGDAWKENILFKYDEDNKPVQACLIDFQTARIASPAFDVLYLIISSTNTQLRKQKYYDMLDIYYKSFSTSLRDSKLDPGELYSREQFNQDLKVVALACFITANTALWLSNGLQEDGHVRSKQVWTIPEEKEVAVNNYKLFVKAIIDDFYSYGYLPGEML